MLKVSGCLLWCFLCCVFFAFYLFGYWVNSREASLNVNHILQFVGVSGVSTYIYMYLYCTHLYLRMNRPKKYTYYFAGHLRLLESEQSPRAWVVSLRCPSNFEFYIPKEQGCLKMMIPQIWMINSTILYC